MFISPTLFWEDWMNFLGVFVLEPRTKLVVCELRDQKSAKAS